MAMILMVMLRFPLAIRVGNGRKAVWFRAADRVGRVVATTRAGRGIGRMRLYGLARINRGSTPCAVADNLIRLLNLLDVAA